MRGAVEAPQPPIVELNEQDIASYGASSLADLVQQLSTETGSGRGRGSGRPVFLVNGLRVSSFREMQSYPPEAIKTVQVLPEEVAQKYGFPPDQRVINFILKDNFSSRPLRGAVRPAVRRRHVERGLRGDVPQHRRQEPAQLRPQAQPHHAADRSRAGDHPDVVPTYPTDPDPAEFRTLVAENTDYQLTGNWTKGLGDSGASLAVNGTAERVDNLSFSGLNTVPADRPRSGATALRTFGTDFPLARRARAPTPSRSAARSTPTPATGS